MRSGLVLLLCLTVLTSCAASRRTAQLTTCLKQPDVAKAVQGEAKAAYAGTVMVAGISSDSQLHCYWTDATARAGHKAEFKSDAWTMCRRENNVSCTILIDHGKIVEKISPRKSELTPDYELSGKFAKAFAEQYQTQGGNAANQPAGSLRCSAPIKTSSESPTYVCR